MKKAALIKVLDEMSALLVVHGAKDWADNMQNISRRLKNSDYSGIEKLLAVYGGMGSFSDLVLVAEPESTQEKGLATGDGHSARSMI